MIRLIKKFWIYIKYIANAKKTWSRPNKSSVLVYDASGADIIFEYIKQWSPEVLHLRGESINLQVLLLALLKGGKPHDSYVDEYIRIVEPDLIITFIDNNLNFLTISDRHKSIKTLFIQNGMRYYYGDIFYTMDSIHPSNLKKLTVDYMMTFGELIGSHYQKYISGSVIPIGSIKNNLVPKKSSKDNNVMAYLSQYKGGRNIDGRYYDYESYAGKSVKFVIQFLKDYAELNKKKLKIIPRFSKGLNSRIQEEYYYENLLGYEPQFLESEQDFSSYHACDMSEVVISIDSTLGIESIARGNKTAIFSIRGSMLDLKGFDYGWPGDYPEKGLFWTNQCDAESFKKNLDYLFNVDNMQWHEDLEKINFSLIMKYDEGNAIFKDTINKIIEASKVV